jgi:hypothetical protein
MDIGGFIKQHTALSIGIAFVGALVIYTVFKNKSGGGMGTGTTTAQDLSGLGTDASGNHVVYVPTQTSFSTSNVGADFSNDPNLQSVQTGAIISNSPVTGVPIAPVQKSAPTQVTNATPSPPPPAPLPSPIPKPPSGGTSTGGVHPVKLPSVPAPISKSLKWMGTYSVVGGDTLSGIAAKVTAQAKAAGAPGSTVVTYQQIYNFNKTMVDGMAKLHGNPVPGGPQNNIFPGETLVIPVWR